MEVLPTRTAYDSFGDIVPDSLWEHYGDWADIDSEAAAEAFIDECLDGASESDIQKVRDAYCGIRFVTVRYNEGVGVSISDQQQEPSSSTVAPDVQIGHGVSKLVQLFAFTDSAKDFDPAPLPGRKPKNIADTVPVQHIVDALKPDLPAGLDAGMCRSFVEFTDFMRDTEDLHFEGETVKNPLFKESVRSAADIPFDATYEQAVEFLVGRIDPSKKLMPVDVVCKDQGKKKVVYVSQIADLCYCLKTRFGSSGTFVVDDSSNDALMLMTATRHMDAAFYQKFVIVMDPKVLPQKPEWIVRLCDANLFDGGQHTHPKVVVRSAETGPVPGTHVVLKGAFPPVHVHGTPVPSEFEIGKHNESEFAMELDGVESRHTGDYGQHETGVLCKSINDDIAAGKDITKSLSLKRAGDWGQIQHCKRYGCVWVSIDTISCSYAAATDVPVVCLSRRKHQDYCRLSFVMGGKTNVAPTWTMAQSGGGIRSATRAVLTTIVLAMALINSVMA